MNTPFQWGKQVASHFGGTRNPLVVSWPARIKDKGGVRTQFHDVIDVAPTILEAAGVPEPVEVNGVWQKPIEGVSMVYSFDDAWRRTAAERSISRCSAIARSITTAGSRSAAMAACRGRMPASFDFANDIWELYNIDEDFSEANDLAAKNPDKLRELQDLFWAEAAKYNVLPLDDRFAERADPSLRPSLIAGQDRLHLFRRRLSHSGEFLGQHQEQVACDHRRRSTSPDDGVLVAAGGTVGGYTLFVKDGKPTYEYNWFGMDRYRVTSSEPLPAGKSTIRVEFKYDGGGVAKGGAVTMFVNDKKVAEGRVEKTIFGRFSADETFDTGFDTGSPVSDLYQSPFKFTGALDRIEIDIAPTKFGALDDQRIRAALRAAAEAEE